RLHPKNRFFPPSPHKTPHIEAAPIGHERWKSSHLGLDRTLNQVVAAGTERRKHGEKELVTPLWQWWGDLTLTIKLCDVEPSAVLFFQQLQPGFHPLHLPD